MLAYSFDGWELQVTERRLLDAGVDVALEAKPFAVLLSLVERAGAVVSYRELAESVWPGERIAVWTMHQAVSSLRKKLRQPPKRTRYPIETLQGLGYRLTAKVDTLHLERPAPLRLPRGVWRSYVRSAARAPRTAAECIAIADALAAAELDRYGPL